VTAGGGGLRGVGPGHLLQTILDGRGETHFGRRALKMTADHWRLSVAEPVASRAIDASRDAASEDDGREPTHSLWIHLPAALLRARGSRLLVTRDIDCLQRVRLPMGDALRTALHDACSRLSRERVVAIGDEGRVARIVDALDEELAGIIARFDRLPGRSLFKRADLYMRLEAARDHIEDHFQDDPSTPFLAEISHISRAHFIRLFSSFYGISPKQMTLKMKLREARRLLRESGRSVAEIAVEAGFGNRCAFQRLFKDRIGMTPLQYRRFSRETAFAAASDKAREQRRFATPDNGQDRRRRFEPWRCIGRSGHPV